MRTYDPKDPNADLDYTFDWNDWFEEGDTDEIVGYEILVPSELTLGTHSLSQGEVRYWISGGVPGTTYEIVCEIETLAGRTDQRTARLPVKNT